jgi:hypothetical protein
MGFAAPTLVSNTEIIPEFLQLMVVNKTGYFITEKY